MSRKKATATLIHRPSLYFYRGIILIGLVLLVAREIHWGISSVGDDPTRRLDLNLFEHILLPATDTNSTTADVPCTSQLQTKGAPQIYDEYAHDDNILVQYGDSIYVRTGWDAAPIVLEDYKVVFFTTAKVGCTVFKQLFRRMLGIPQWQDVNLPHLIPWNPEVNGLRYLYHYNRTAASHMMTAPDWTRAIFVRDPKTRFLSAYLDKVVRVWSSPSYAIWMVCWHVILTQWLFVYIGWQPLLYPQGLLPHPPQLRELEYQLGPILSSRSNL
jgi:hypothetical protein